MRRLTASALLLAFLGGCTLGPDFVRPTPAAPDDWGAWRSGDASLALPVGTGDALPADWWRLFGDPVLDALEQRAFAASPDLRTATLHFAQARVQRLVADAQQWPQVDLNGAVTRQRQSENGAGSRVLRAIAGDQADPFIKLVSEPFTLYQAGFDASWELDLWGRVRRSVEAAGADVERQGALLDLARLSLASEVAQNYFELRTVQRSIRLMRADVAALQQRIELMDAQVRSGVTDHLPLERQKAEAAGLRAQLPALLAQEAASMNRIALLLDEHPGALRAQLQDSAADTSAAMPDLSAGLPSEIARRRPDIRAAEARLHGATASIGVARADLYPSVRIGAHAGSETYTAPAFTDWASRAWSIGPSFTLPIFDQGRRRGVVQLRELEQQEAAVAYQRTVLQAWHEIDDALTGYAAESLQERELAARALSARQLLELVQARYDGGVVDYTAVIDTQRTWLQARRDLVASQGRLRTKFVAVNKAIGNAPQQGFTVSQRQP